MSSSNCWKQKSLPRKSSPRCSRNGFLFPAIRRAHQCAWIRRIAGSRNLSLGNLRRAVRVGAEWQDTADAGEEFCEELLRRCELRAASCEQTERASGSERARIPGSPGDRVSELQREVLV